MPRNLKRRLEALDPRRDDEELLAALAVVIETGKAPTSRVGERAAELWAAASEQFDADSMRVLWCHIQITGKSVAELLH